MAQPTLQMRLFGDFSLSYDGVPVPSVTSARLRSLLAYLVLHRDAPQPRHHLAALFWPDATDEQARGNLRQMLHHLRQALPQAGSFLSVDASSMRWREDAPCSLDVAEFEHALSRADAAARRQDLDAQRDALAAAVAVYRADLLPSCYDEWIGPVRERLRNLLLGALASLVRLLEALHEYEAAGSYARTWISHDPLAEEAYRALMRLLALSGDRAGALRVYHTCAATLRRELGIDPSPATNEAHERLLRLTAPPAGRDRQPAAAAPAFIGRRREWAQLQAAWQRAGAGEPCFALVAGEAGIGKSRLAEELLAWASQRGATVARARSYATEGQLSLAPVTDWLRSDGLRPHLERLDAVWRTEISRILPEILAAHPDLPRPEPITEYGQRSRFFEALARAMLAAPQPLLMLADDLQWCDPETLEWLHFLLRFDASARLLVLGAARTEEVAPQHPLRTLLLHLARTTRMTEIALQPLDAAETAGLAAALAGCELETGAALRLYRETEGNPLFVVETVRAGMVPVPEGASETIAQESPDARDHPMLPPRVYAVIAGRLARLSAPARDLVGVTAAIGRAFGVDLLLAAGAGDEDSVVRALDELWTARIIREQQVNSYDFTHDKLREVAYAEVGAPQRRLLHRRIAQALEDAHAEVLDPVSGEIAAHYERAGVSDRAIPLYQRAGAVAQRVYANDDAIGLFTRALALLEQLPSGMKRDAQELSLLLALAPALRVTKGWAAPELERTLDRAQALCDTIGDDAQRTQVLYGLQSLYVVQARLAKVAYISGELDTLYRRSHGTPPPRFAGVMLTGARLHLGHVREANERFDAIAAVHDPDQLQRLQAAQGVNYMVLAQAWQSHALWCLGYPESALRLCRGADQMARDLAQPFNQALAATYLAMLAQLCADDAGAGARAEEALALCGDYKAPYYRAWSAILVNYARAWERPDAEHIAHLRDAISALTAAGARLRLPYYLSLLARVYGKAGRADEGLSAIDEALAAARAHNERWWDAELHRLRGELLLARGAALHEGEAALLRALDIARTQQARSLELRAATALARLWAAQGREDEGRRLLGDLCAWFTEGFATSDMRAARSLLAHLA